MHIIIRSPLIIATSLADLILSSSFRQGRIEIQKNCEKKLIINENKHLHPNKVLFAVEEILFSSKKTDSPLVNLN
jgi:hypothetical protein